MIPIEKEHIHKLLCAQNPDAALLYLYLKAGNDPMQAQTRLGYSQSRLALAGATLRQLGLLAERKPVQDPGEPPVYTEEDVQEASDTDMDFVSLCDEVQRLLGKHLNTEERKILLGFVRYLGFSSDVVAALVHYCIDYARKKGNLRGPTLRTIQQKAYAWHDMGINTMEEAAQYMRRQNQRFSMVGRIMEKLQIRGRNLTAPEKRYIKQWLEMGFDEQTIGLAYERSCLNTGGMSWPYVNKILLRWHESGLHTLAEIQSGDHKPTLPKGASGQLGDAEMEAIQRLMKEG